MFVTVGVPSQNLDGKRKDGQESIRLSIVARVIDQNDTEPDRYHSWTVTKVYEAEALDEARKDGTLVVGDTEELRLPAGNYELIIAVRDDETGRMGTAKTIVTAPDFQLPFSSSSVLLTTRRRPDRQDESSSRSRPFLTVDGTELVPEARADIHPGMAIYFLYEVYNVSASVTLNPPPFQIFLWKDCQRVAGARLAGRMFALPDEQKIRYVASLDTADLEPGTYTAYFALPTERGTTKELLRKQFEILSRTK